MKSHPSHAVVMAKGGQPLSGFIPTTSIPSHFTCSCSDTVSHTHFSIHIHLYCYSISPFEHPVSKPTSWRNEMKCHWKLLFYLLHYYCLTIKQEKKSLTKNTLLRLKTTRWIAQVLKQGQLGKPKEAMLPSNKTVAMLICFCKLKLAMLTLPLGSSDWSTVLKLTLMSGTTCHSWNSFNLKEHSTFFGNRLILSGAMIWRSAWK